MLFNSQRRVRVAITPLASFLEKVRRTLQFPEDGVTIRLVSDATMGVMNRDFRGKHGPTDVLSFPASHHPSRNNRNRRKSYRLKGYIGDIAISPETARRNARQQSRSLSKELRILILHGMIHLAGYDHETDHGEMDRFERRMRKRLGLA